MRYVYTDFGSLPVNFALTMDEVDRLLEFIEEIEESKNPWLLSDLKKMLISSREHTADLMHIHAKQMQEKPDV